MGKLLPTAKARDWKSGLGTNKERQKRDLDKIVLRKDQIMDDMISEESTSSQEASPASLFPMLENEPEYQTSVTSGRRCLELSESLNRPLSLAKTLLVSSVWKMAKHLTGYSLTWKMKDTPQNRLLFQLVPSEHGTGGTEFGLLLTPSTVQIEPTEDRAEKRKA